MNKWYLFSKTDINLFYFFIKFFLLVTMIDYIIVILFLKYITIGKENYQFVI